MNLNKIVLLLLTSLLFSYIFSSSAILTSSSHILKKEESSSAQNLPGAIPVSKLEVTLEREAGSSNLTLLGTKRKDMDVEPQLAVKMKSKMAVEVLDYGPPQADPKHSPPPTNK